MYTPDAGFATSLEDLPFKVADRIVRVLEEPLPRVSRSGSEMGPLVVSDATIGTATGGVRMLIWTE